MKRPTSKFVQQNILLMNKSQTMKSSTLLFIACFSSVLVYEKAARWRKYTRATSLLNSVKVSKKKQRFLFALFDQMQRNNTAGNIAYAIKNRPESLEAFKIGWMKKAHSTSAYQCHRKIIFNFQPTTMDPSHYRWSILRHCSNASPTTNASNK